MRGTIISRMRGTIVVAALTALVAMTIVAAGGGTVITGPSSLVDNAVTNAKLRDSAALSVIGRSANSIGDPSDIAAANDGEVLRRSGTALGFGTVTTAGIADNAVTLAKVAGISTNRILGRITAGTGAPEELTGTQVTSLLDAVTTSAKGLVPTAPNDTTKFLRGDGTWAGVAIPSSPSLSTPSSTNKAFSSNQSECNAALSTVGTHEWISFLTGGWGSTSAWFGRGLNPVSTSTSNQHVKRSSRLSTGTYFIGSFTGSSVGNGTISVSSVASDDATNAGMAATAFSVELVSNSPGYGFGFDVPMMANESGTVTMCVLHASFGFTVSANFGDGSVSPTSLAVANFDPSAGATGISLITIPFTNGANGGNRLRVQVVTSGTRAPFNASLDPGYIYW